MRGWRTLLPYVPAALLCLVAVVQVYLTRTASLTPWKGGGFGMFSTSDQERKIRIWATGPNGTAVLPAEEFYTAYQAGAFPSDRRLQILAENVASSERAKGNPVDQVRMKVWRITYDVHTMRPDSELLRDASVRVRSRR